MKILSLLFIIGPAFIFNLALAGGGKAQFEILTQPLVLQAGQAKSAKLSISMAPGFHAYADQFKVISIVPENFKIGQIKLSPEVEFFDKHFKKMRKGLFEKGEIELQIESPEKLLSPMETLSFDLKYQICSDQVCYLPQTFKAKIEVKFMNDLTQNNVQVNEPKKADPLATANSFENQLSKNIFLTFLLVFFAGVLTSFTPCIFPMIPITLSILGNNAHAHSRSQNILRSVFYVLGIALTYSSLGVIAALTGSFFGQALANKYVVAGLVLLFIVMALSMWGAFELQVPAFIRNRFGTGKSQGYLGALTMGLVAGLVASPCVGPVLVSILSFVSTTQNVILGFTLLFTYAIGLGLIFIVIGSSSQILKKLPRSGPWMDMVKFVLGLIMICMALYYLKLIVPVQVWLAAIGLVFSAIAVGHGAFNFKQRKPLRQGLFLTTFVFSFALFLLSSFSLDYVVPLVRAFNTESTATKLTWTPYSEEAIKQAKAEGKPVFLDFYADWCGACLELEEKTYSVAEFAELSKSFKLIKVNATEDNPETQKITSQYGVRGLPTVIFMNKQGDILSDLTFTQFLEWSDLKPIMLKALE